VPSGLADALVVIVILGDHGQVPVQQVRPSGLLPLRLIGMVTDRQMAPVRAWQR
jgi:hypothetical protein